MSWEIEKRSGKLNNLETMIFLIFVAIFILSFILARRSMKDFGLSKEIKDAIVKQRKRGTIVFFKGKKIQHYSSRFSSSSTPSRGN